MPPQTSKPSIPVESTEAVNVYRTNAACPVSACGGSMQHDGYSVPLTGPLGPDAAGRWVHRHACQTCKTAAWYLDTYPKVYYVSAAAESRVASAAAVRAAGGEGV